MIAYWVFMFLFSLMLPLTMIGFGLFFQQQAPGEINRSFGYRTRRSMKNPDTWSFAQRHIGKTWKWLGLVTLVLSIAVMLPLSGREIEQVGKIGSFTIGIQVVLLIGSVFPTEMALKRTFDDNGKRTKLTTGDKNDGKV